MIYSRYPKLCSYIISEVHHQKMMAVSINAATTDNNSIGGGNLYSGISSIVGPLSFNDFPPLLAAFVYEIYLLPYFVIMYNYTLIFPSFF